ncbi:DnaB-like helicase C-terminal domain-containing protein, partial [Escherichia coli]|uniref:DnaB-like helicase C-terminal domain-containing protein n=1 Tax=Escherichia coli TaxID=562 RepID=UPI0039DF9124
TGQTTTLLDALHQAYTRIDARTQRDEMLPSGIPTGYLDLDELTAGFQNSELIIVAARPSVGKTALALNFARHAVVEEKV